MATINDVGDLKEELENAASGTDIVLDPDKAYYCNSDTTIRINAENVRVIGFGPKFVQDPNFNPEVPEDGRAVIKGDGELTFEGCKGLQIIGFFFRLPFTMDDCRECNVAYCDLQYDKAETDVFNLKDGIANVMQKCKFHDKKTKGLFLKIHGEKTRDNIIESSEFWGHTFNKENGGEPVRVGNSSVGHIFFNTTFRYCHFHDLKADVETISIKSCGNHIYRCLHENNESSIVVRHGHTNTIEECVFRGSGGIRVYGKDNKILRNHLSDNRSEKFPPLTLVNGDRENERGTGDSHADYTQVRNNEIIGNVFVNCTPICVIWGRDNGDRKFKPTQNKFLDNIIIAEGEVKSKALEFSAGAAVGNNGFANNVIYGNVNRGDLPESGCKVVTQKPEVKIPEVQVVAVPPTV